MEVGGWSRITNFPTNGSELQPTKIHHLHTSSQCILLRQFQRENGVHHCSYIKKPGSDFFNRFLVRLTGYKRITIIIIYTSIQSVEQSYSLVQFILSGSQYFTDHNYYKKWSVYMCRVSIWDWFWLYSKIAFG